MLPYIVVKSSKAGIQLRVGSAVLRPTQTTAEGVLISPDSRPERTIKQPELFRLEFNTATCHVSRVGTSILDSDRLRAACKTISASRFTKSCRASIFSPVSRHFSEPTALSTRDVF